VAAAPPRPLYTVPAAFVLAAALSPAVAVAEDDAVVLVSEALGGDGSRAPQGWSSLQADWQVFTPPQPATHVVPYCVQMKYGSV
jgi:hypothetical protein